MTRPTAAKKSGGRRRLYRTLLWRVTEELYDAHNVIAKLRERLGKRANVGRWDRRRRRDALISELLSRIEDKKKTNLE